MLTNKIVYLFYVWFFKKLKPSSVLYTFPNMTNLSDLAQKYLDGKELSANEKINLFTNTEHPDVTSVLTKDLAKKISSQIKTAQKLGMGTSLSTDKGDAVGGLN